MVVQTFRRGPRRALAPSLAMVLFAIAGCGGQSVGPSIGNADELADFARILGCGGIEPDDNYDKGLFAGSDAVQLPPYECDEPDMRFYLVNDADRVLELAASDQRDGSKNHGGVYHGTSVVVITSEKTVFPQLLDAGLRRLVCDEDAEEYLGTDKEESPVEGCIFVHSPYS